MNTLLVYIKSFKTKVYAQDRLKKYVKKNINEVEVGKLKMHKQYL